MLWDIIRDWFVQYIWGGVSSVGEAYGGNLGTLFYIEDGVVDFGNVLNYTNNLLIPTNFYDYETDHANLFISFGDWLSTTSTIIVLILLCVVFGLMVRWLFRLTSGLLQGR